MAKTMHVRVSTKFDELPSIFKKNAEPELKFVINSKVFSRKKYRYDVSISGNRQRLEQYKEFLNTIKSPNFLIRILK